MHAVLVRSSDTYEVTQVTCSSALLRTTARHVLVPASSVGMFKPSANVRSTRNLGIGLLLSPDAWCALPTQEHASVERRSSGGPADEEPGYPPGVEAGFRGPTELERDDRHP